MRPARIILAALAAGCLLATPAAADPLVDDLAIARATLPADHPCRAHVDVALHGGLRATDGTIADGLAQWGRRDPTTGAWDPVACVIAFDPAAWARWTPCQRRRKVMHEVGHLGGRDDDSGGIMAQTTGEQDRVSVPGCRGLGTTLRERAEDRLLDLVPLGWEVACGDRRGRSVRCRAEHGRRMRRYRVTLDGAGLRIERVGGRL